MNIAKIASGLLNKGYICYKPDLNLGLPTFDPDQPVFNVKQWFDNKIKDNLDKI